MKKILASILASAMMLSLAACGGSAPAESSSAAPAAPAAPAASSEAPAGGDAAPAGGGKVGVSMPTQSLQRWNQDGSNMKAELEAAGYEVDLQYAGDNDIPTQVSQLENMISNGCEALVVAAIDGSSLTEVLKGAKDAGIPVISYDRLIMNSDAISYYATFDNYKVGTFQGNFIKDALDLDNAEGPFNIELVTGSPDDNNVNFFFGGAMDVLKPYMDSGKLVVLSGQTEKAQCATPNWSAEESQKRMENLERLRPRGHQARRSPLLERLDLLRRTERADRCGLHRGEHAGHHWSGLRQAERQEHRRRPAGYVGL